MAQGKAVSEKITPGQVRLIKTVAGKLGVETDAMAIGYSEGRTPKVSELTSREAAGMIRELQKMDPANRDEAAAENMRRKLIAMAYAWKGLPKMATPAEKRNAQAALREWCVKYGYKHKPLDEYTYDELPKLVTQFEGVLNSLIIKF